MTDFIGKCPDGKYTSDPDKYSKEWAKLSKQFENLGFEVTALDPGIQMVDATTQGGVFTLPVYAAMRIIKAINRE